MRLEDTIVESINEGEKMKRSKRYKGELEEYNYG